jgi:predicted nucleic acid-binding protein
MKYLVDTDWVIDYLKGKPSAVEALTRLSEDGLAISLITYGEIYEGIYFSRNPQASEKGFLQFLRGVRVLPLNKLILKRFARLRGELRRTGNLIGDPDLLIAATTLQYNLVLLSRNRSDFQRISELRLWET